MLWNPLASRANEQRWIWLTASLWILLFRGPAFLGNVRSPGDVVPDFFQEYASARNWLEGLPIYTDHRQTAPRYLHVSLDSKRAHVFANGHPPTSVLCALPFAKFDFADSFLAWNLVSISALAGSLWIVQRQLRIPFSYWSIAPLLSLLLLCYPLWEQIRLGQLTLVLLLLLTGSWAAERSGRPWLAGVLLGAAATIKLSPAFLFLYYALRGRWYVVIAGVVTIASLTGLTAIVLGLDAYRSYFLTVLPEIQRFRVGWNNDSLWGFWSRLFDPAPEHARDRSLTDPIFYSPGLAVALSLAASAAVVGVLTWAVRRDRQGRKNDLTFALAVTAMLLVSPICWEHYLLLLLVPLAVVWEELPAGRFARALFLVIVTAVWLGYPLVWTAFDLNGRTATPIDSLGVLSYQFYSLLGLVALILIELGTECRPTDSTSSTRRALTFGAAVMALLWVHVLHSVWQDYGLFYYVAGDFGIYLSIARATLADGSRALYDLDLVAPFARDLTRYHGPFAGGPNVGPGPYPAVYILPFLCLTMFSPPVGYVIWTSAGVMLGLAVARGMSARVPGRGWGLAASGVLFFPRRFRPLFRPVDLGAALWVLSRLPFAGGWAGLPSWAVERRALS
jgi:hypothetical protein